MRYSWNNLFRRGNVTYLWDIFARASPRSSTFSLLLRPLLFSPSPRVDPRIIERGLLACNNRRGRNYRGAIVLDR